MRSLLIPAGTGITAPTRIICLPGAYHASEDWRFIQTQRGGRPRLYLGYGHEDRFSAAHRLMAQAMAPDAVDVVPGGHDWRTWTSLWENFLTSRFA